MRLYLFLAVILGTTPVLALAEGAFDEADFQGRLMSAVHASKLMPGQANVCLSLGEEALKLGRRDYAQMAFRYGLAMEPMHEGLLHRVGFNLVNGKVVPRIDDLLSNGWWLSGKRWAPSKQFDFSAYEQVGNSVRSGVLNLRTKLGKEGYEDSLNGLKKTVDESGIMAAPALARLTRGGDPEIKAMAYGLLAPLKPEFMDAELMELYPKEEDPRVAAGMASVIASVRKGQTLPTHARGVIQKGPLDESARWSQLAAQMDDKSCIPLILNRWKLLRRELITIPGGARNVITFLQQQAYIRDLTAVVGVQVGLFDPDIGYIQSGTVLDVRVVKVEIFRSTLQMLTGNMEGFDPEDFE
ncbi:MAG: hypothetical protein AB7F75_13370 [Planctomycetota bacterium]